MNIAYIARLNRAKTAIGDALSSENLDFVDHNYQHIEMFLRSDDGKAAINNFISEWKIYVKSKV